MKLSESIEAAGAFLPSVLRDWWRRHRLQKRHGFSRIKPFDPYSIHSSTFGDRCFITAPVSIWNCSIGDFSRVREFAHVESTNVGKFCSIARNAFVGLGPHALDSFASQHPYFYHPHRDLGYPPTKRTGPPHPTTRLGNDVWIGAGARVVAGTVIGDGAVVAAGSVLTKDVPPYAIFGGVPARLIRFRFADRVIEKLLEIKWWDLGDAWLRNHLHLMQNVERLIEEMDESPEIAGQRGPDGDESTTRE